MFELPSTYDIDIPGMEKRFRDLSLKLHPDRFAQADAKERRLSLEQTTSLNEAYKTLKDPSRRAFYLLKLHGVDLDREDAGAQKDMPAEFLEEVIELREELEGAMASRDLTRAQAMAVDVTARQREALTEAAEALRALQDTSDDTALVKKASHALGRVRYFTRFLEQVEEFEEEVVT
ncbi:Fe-S protein assembly co-chaperone HscB [Hyalangium rubrum]|uniref:Co-chaperone protein HscB homolog n=1 Tax=Hyalangium rubrum TaxID=3103134 RepID=A0ABU5HC54_9BACT|nr:Fe-S protein assembly co-chaperone HscB [Hyalangium sp. s54d21]MDY7229675.1 Fe-S protein assembly co-chaperone HscB [Hyalangium sp. s54d21]